MRLSMQDKNEFLKAAIKAPDLESLRLWVVSVVDAVDALPDGKADTPVPTPAFVLPAASGHGLAARSLVLGAAQDASTAREQWENGALLT